VLAVDLMVVDLMVVDLIQILELVLGEGRRQGRRGAGL
jgi:hypothetical protein